jgi:3-methyladenine DNA glycosylase AlkD
MNTKEVLLKEMKDKGSVIIAKHSLKFFKTGKGEYGEGDLFWGIRVPDLRILGKKYQNIIDLKDIKELLKHKIHEVRLIALIILSDKYKTASQTQQKTIASLYLKNTKYINNWDLVDLSAPIIAGHFWFNNKKDSKQMFQFAKSKDLWKERISIVANLYFIRQNKFEEILFLSKIFLSHKHDLIHKATGWMLREAGKKDKRVLIGFLNKFYLQMPRTMLRYSIERLSDKERKHYMSK